ncbi:MAG: biotin--[acetyl-CoA-carboxylase] ligase [bacterium]|nr:biotin--[acetyl-CoA-carboxylase] ligase [bacterium]
MENKAFTKIAEEVFLRRGETFTVEDIVSYTGFSSEQVNRTIHRLNELGFEIRLFGERLLYISPPPLESVKSDAASSLVVKSTVTTTMDVAPRLAERGAETPLAVFADEQTAGRGREGREWMSPSRLGIYTTIAIDYESPSISPTLFGLGTGLALVRILENEYKELSGRLKLKWPNDVMLDGAKTAGILSVKKGAYLYIGYGVNVYNLRMDLPETAYYETTSLLLSSVVVEDRGRLGGLVVSDVLAALTDWDDEAVHNLWRGYDYFVGQRIAVVSDNRSIVGVAAGIGPLGELLVETESGVENVVSGDIVEVR